MRILHALLISTALAGGGAQAQTTQTTPAGKASVDQTGAVKMDPNAVADSDMKRVIDTLKSLNGKSIATLSAEEARKQPTPADAVKALLSKDGKSASPDAGVTTKDITYDGPGGALKARIYTPAGMEGKALPVVLYLHGGGWVIANIDVYDASPRALAKLTGAIFVSAEYRFAPEHKFPAAHDDAVAAYKWVLANARSFGGDPGRVALAGESAGGNLALNVAIAARDQKFQAPLGMVLVYPVAGVDMDTKSYKDNAGAVPLNKAMMGWFFDKTVKSQADLADPRLDLAGKANLAGLPPAAVITAEIDPLRTEGMLLAQKLKAAGVQVEARDYTGVTHEFFGMGAVVAKARQAEEFAAAELKKYLASQAKN